MTNLITTLTTKDFMTLELIQKHAGGLSESLSLILKKKIDSANVVFREDLPDCVASLNSRITYSVNGKTIGTRVLAHDQTDYPVGFTLPVTSKRGLALLGLCVGEAFVITNEDGREERIVLEKILFQPQAARRYREAMSRPRTPTERRAALKIHEGGIDDFWRRRTTTPDDHGPSAA